MADTSANLKDWSTTAASNSPSDATTLGAGLADNLQTIQAVVRQDLAHKGSDIVAAATTDIGAVAGSYHDITGNSTISSYGTVSAGISKWLKYEGTPLVVNSTAVALLGASNRTMAAGDTQHLYSEGSGIWREMAYFSAAYLASSTASGVIELATQAEVDAGSDTARAITPATHAAYTPAKSFAYVTAVNTDTDTDSPSFTAASIGASHPSRCVHLVIHMNGGTPALSSVTIGGILAEINVQATNTDSLCAIASAFVPTGATTTIALVGTGTILGTRVGIYRSIGLQSTTAVDSDNSTADPGTATLDSLVGGFCLSGASKNAADSLTWTNVTENYDTTSAESRVGSGASVATAATSIAPSGNYATGAGVAVFATF